MFLSVTRQERLKRTLLPSHRNQKHPLQTCVVEGQQGKRRQQKKPPTGMASGGDSARDDASTKNHCQMVFVENLRSTKMIYQCAIA
jgi:hypothetical protein